MYQGKELLLHLYDVKSIMVRFQKAQSDYLWLANHMLAEKKVWLDSKRGKAAVSLSSLLALPVVLQCLIFLLSGKPMNIIYFEVIPIALFFLLKPHHPAIAWTIMGYWILQGLYLVVLIVLTFIQGNRVDINLTILAFILSVIAVIIVAGIQRKRARKYNAKAYQVNTERAAHSMQLQEEIQVLGERLVSGTEGWYSQSYMYLKAINFFIDRMEKNMDYTMKELVNLYEAQLQHEAVMNQLRRQAEIQERYFREMVANQEMIRMQLEWGNMLAFYRSLQNDRIIRALDNIIY